MNTFYRLLFLFVFIQNVLATDSKPLYTPTNIGNKTVYNIGVIFPDPSNLTSPRYTAMKDIILTNELAIRLAAESIENKQILSGLFDNRNSKEKEANYLFQTSRLM